jgi:non-heme chloroperoxidase
MPGHEHISQEADLVHSSLTSAKRSRMKGATLKVYPGAPHGMCSTLKDQVNQDLLAFFKA